MPITDFNLKNMKNYFIIHGFIQGNIDNWYPWIKKQIDSNNKYCVIPQFPIDIEHQNYNSWKIILDAYKKNGMINTETILIGHSTGCAFIIKYILEYHIKVSKIVLVSGFNNFFASDPKDLHNKVNKTFYINNDKLKEITNYVNEIICLYGDNDPYIPQNVLHEFCEKLNAKEIIIHNGGHINTKSGYGEFDELLKYIN